MTTFSQDRQCTFNVASWQVKAYFHTFSPILKTACRFSFMVIYQ